MTTAALRSIQDLRSRAAEIDGALPQTQCTRCGYPDCRSYADAIAHGDAAIDQCPPGGAEGVARLATITGLRASAVNPANGIEGPLRLALIDENWCIGCTLCIKACPVDCIVGAPKRMHTVVESLCTGCELCIPACPVDCISLMPVDSARTGWAAWSAPRADEARERYALHRERLARDKSEADARLAAKPQSRLPEPTQASAIADPAILEKKRSVIEGVLARSRTRRNERDAQ